MVLEMRRIHELPQVGTPYRQSDVKDEAVQPILQESPDENADRQQPDEIVEPALLFTARGEIKQAKCQKRVNPKGTKMQQPVFRRHTDSHSSQGAPTATEIS